MSAALTVFAWGVALVALEFVVAFVFGGAARLGGPLDTKRAGRGCDRLFAMHQPHRHNGGTK